MAIVDDRIGLVGNINNPETLYSKGPDAVRGEVIRALDAGVRMIGPECAIPLQTPIENLRAIHDTVIDWHAARASAPASRLTVPRIRCPT